MDFSNYTFYTKPISQPKPDVLFRVVVNLVSALLLLGFYYLSINCPDTQWPVRENIPQEMIDEDNFHSGDILLVFEQGHDFIFFPGHMAMVVELPKYQQKYVWDLPIPLKYVPNVLKPLSAYLTRSLRQKEAKLYVHHLHNRQQAGNMPTKAIMQSIKEMSVSIHFKLQAAHDHANFCAHNILGFPGVPDFLPHPVVKDLHYCASAIFQVMIKCGVLKPEILQEIPVYLREKARWGGTGGSIIYPQMFVSPDWDLSLYVNDAWYYTHVTELKSPQRVKK